MKYITLWRYDTIKTWRWNFFKFSWVVHMGKCVTIRFKRRGSPCYFLSSRGQKIKNITKIVYILGFIFMVFLAQKLIYTINIWFNFVFGSFFQQDHLLNLFISWVIRKDDLNAHVFNTKTDVAQNLIYAFFSNFDCQRTFP